MAFPTHGMAHGSTLEPCAIPHVRNVFHQTWWEQRKTSRTSNPESHSTRLLISHDASNRPDVHFVTVPFLGQNFRCNIVGCATHGPNNTNTTWITAYSIKPLTKLELKNLTSNSRKHKIFKGVEFQSLACRTTEIRFWYLHFADDVPYLSNSHDWSRYVDLSEFWVILNKSSEKNFERIIAIIDEWYRDMSKGTH